jgi:hypothetical protein
MSVALKNLIRFPRGTNSRKPVQTRMKRFLKNAGKLIDLRYRDSIGGLTTKGFDVEGCCISSGAVQRARLEGLKRELNVPFSTASMLQLTSIGRSSFDAVKSRSRAAEK